MHRRTLLHLCFPWTLKQHKDSIAQVVYRLTLGRRYHSCLLPYVSHTACVNNFIIVSTMLMPAARYLTMTGRTDGAGCRGIPGAAQRGEGQCNPPFSPLSACRDHAAHAFRTQWRFTHTYPKRLQGILYSIGNRRWRRDGAAFAHALDAEGIAG